MSLTAAALATAGTSGFAQSAPAVRVGSLEITGYPEDWSHRHVVFSNPGTEQEAIQSGRYTQWLKAVNDPRYVLNQLKRNLPVVGPAETDANYRARWISEASGDRSAASLAPETLAPKLRFRDRSLPSFPAEQKLARPKSDMSNDWNESVGTATSSTAINSPAKWSFATGSESCANDFVVFSTGQAGSSTQATILGYYNLYSVCGGTVPTVNWQYNTGTGNFVYLAPVFSLDGSQVAFIQSSGTAASLVLLRYKLITSGSGALSSLTTQSSAANYYNSGTGCTTPCMYSIALNGAPNDTWSNPYYEYGSDTLFVGDSAGKLHKFNPVFRGAPAEITTGGWPAQMKRGATTDNNQLASPIYDPNSGYVFVGSTTSVSTTTGGYFYAVNPSSGAIQGYSSTQLDKQYGIRDAPLFDPVAEKAYVFAGYNSADDSAVYQFSATGFSGSTAPVATTTLPTGANSDLAYMFAGTFDNTYYTSNSTTPTGYLYVCPTGDTTDALYQISISAGAMSATATEGPVVGDATHYYPRCSPMTEFYNSNVVVTPATTATGKVTMASNPSGWVGNTVTIGATTYTFVTGAPTANNQVEKYTTSTAANNETRTAANLEAVINATLAECYAGDPACVHTGQAANASVTATAAAAVVSLTSKTSGTAGDFTLTSSNTGDVTVSEIDGTDAVLGEDYLFVSVFASSQTTAGCTEATTNGCVLSFNITNPASFTTSTTPLGALSISSPALNTLGTGNPAAPTSGIIVDNNGTAAGQSQIYFLTQDNAGATACVSGGADGICAIQAAQSAP